MSAITGKSGLVAAATLVSPAMSNGLFSTVAGNVLTATGAATQTLSGYLFGTEE